MLWTHVKKFRTGIVFMAVKASPETVPLVEGRRMSCEDESPDVGDFSNYLKIKDITNGGEWEGVSFLSWVGLWAIGPWGGSRP